MSFKQCWKHKVLERNNECYLNIVLYCSSNCLPNPKTNLWTPHKLPPYLCILLTACLTRQTTTHQTLLNNCFICMIMSSISVIDIVNWKANGIFSDLKEQFPFFRDQFSTNCLIFVNNLSVFIYFWSSRIQFTHTLRILLTPGDWL